MDNKTGFNVARGLLNWLAVETGDPAFLRAGNTFVHSPSGRRPKYPRTDRLAIEEARAMMASGAVRHMHTALCLVARAKFPQQNPQSVAQRLMRKIKRDRRPNRCDHET